MNRKQLQKLGVPPDCVKPAIQALGRAAQVGTGFGMKGQQAKKHVADVLADPRAYLEDSIWGELAVMLLEDVAQQPMEPIEYVTWGNDIDKASHSQMRQACHLPCAGQPP